jgi:hypothetical protein
MRILIIFGAFIVLVTNLIVSFNHTLQLYRNFGVTGGLEYFSVIGAETAFIVGIIYLVHARIKGKSVNFSAKLLLFLGVGLVSWSNISAMSEHGIGGIILGALTPAFLVVVESLLSHEFSQIPTEEIQKELTVQPLEELENQSDVEQEITTPVIEITEESVPTPIIETPLEELNLKERLETPSIELEELVLEKEPPRKKKPSLEEIFDLAVTLQQKIGKLPTRSKLMKEFGISDWKARQLRDRLKSIIGRKHSERRQVTR